MRLALLRAAGQVCQRCTADRCDPDQRPFLECERCGGKGCEACGRRGRVAVKGCVRDQVTGDAWRLIEMAGFTDDGAWPVSGGVLDQTAAYLALYRFVSGTRRQIESDAVAKALKK